MNTAERAEASRVEGLAQGVGFRPAVQRIAVEHRLRGSVCNEGSSTQIVVAGAPECIDDFVHQPRTSMAAFAMRGDCRREYDDPADRRFHAQPIACPQCGPRLRCRPDAADPLRSGRSTINALRASRITAIKGIGGYHPACDATDEAVVLLRRRAATLRRLGIRTGGGSWRRTGSSTSEGCRWLSSSNVTRLDAAQ